MSRTDSPSDPLESAPASGPHPLEWEELRELLREACGTTAVADQEMVCLTDVTHAVWDLLDLHSLRVEISGLSPIQNPVFVVGLFPAGDQRERGWFGWYHGLDRAHAAFRQGVRDSTIQGGSTVVRLVRVDVDPALVPHQITNLIGGTDLLHGIEGELPALRQYVPEHAARPPRAGLETATP